LLLLLWLLPFAVAVGNSSFRFISLDCDTDGDCAFGLVCFQRDLGTANVPGCNGDANMFIDDDFCILPETINTLVIVGDNGEDFLNFPMEACQGDCDRDADCKGDLKCFQRNAQQQVPGCIGVGESSFDYCYQE
jgi:hypothetical protein